MFLLFITLVPPGTAFRKPLATVAPVTHRRYITLPIGRLSHADRPYDAARDTKNSRELRPTISNNAPDGLAGLSVELGGKLLDLLQGNPSTALA